MLDLTTVRSMQALILTLRGHAAQVADTLDWLETTTREIGSTDYIVTNLTAAAFARAALGEHDQAAALLTEIEANPGTRENPNYAPCLPAMVRTALALDNPELAQRLAAGVEPRTPYDEHALATVNAALAEADGDLQAAAEGYADAAERWQSFGVVPEQAFALLGQGRSLTALGRTAEARPVLQQAREIFQTLQAAPALAETDSSSNRQPRSAPSPPLGNSGATRPTEISRDRSPALSGSHALTASKPRISRERPRSAGPTSNLRAEVRLLPGPSEIDTLFGRVAGSPFKTTPASFEKDSNLAQDPYVIAPSRGRALSSDTAGTIAQYRECSTHHGVMYQLMWQVPAVTLTISGLLFGAAFAYDFPGQHGSWSLYWAPCSSS